MNLRHRTKSSLFVGQVIDSGMFSSGSRLLDGGCGSGIAMEPLNRCGYRTAGFDPNEYMLALAIERGLDVRVGDFEHIPFEDASFDGFMTYAAFQFVGREDPYMTSFEHYKQAARELRRVCSGPGMLQMYPSEKQDFAAAKQALKLFYQLEDKYLCKEIPHILHLTPLYA
jgi:ubiquinone/menaquinone biosynthesis C-methylase UbiE